MQSPVDVSVIIVNYNTRQMTSECIESVFEKTRDLVFEIILVDNGSRDGSKEFFEKDNRIKYIYSDKNLGFGRANNLGYKYAKGKYIFLLNSDTILLNNALKEFVDYLELNPTESCCGCILRNAMGNPIHSFGKFLTMKDVYKQYLGYYTRLLKQNTPNKEISLNAYFSPFKVDYITGADIFIRKCIIEKYGLFNEQFFMYYEDSYLQYKYSKHGIESKIIDTPKILHFEGGSKKLKSFRSWAMGFKSEMIYLRLTLNKTDQLKWKLLTTLLIPPVIILYPSTFGDKIIAFKQIFKEVYK